MPEQVEIPLHLCQVLEEELENLPATEASLPPAGASGEQIRAPAVGEEENQPAAPPGSPAPLSSPAKTEGSDVVTVREDWGFHDGHVKDPLRLTAMLSHAAEVWSVTHEGREKPEDRELEAEPDLYTFLAFRYRELWDKKDAAGNLSPDLYTLLNRILRDEDPTGAENPTELTPFSNTRLNLLRLRKGGLRGETQALLNLGMKRGRAYLFEGRHRMSRGVRVMEGMERSGADVFKGEEVLRPRPADLSENERRERESRFAKTDLARFRRLLLEDAFPGALRRAYDLRLAHAVRRLHAVGRSAICFSGGGIRSGTFALGVIQALAQGGLLDKFDYLSTVSGGGYIGGWLTAWIHRHPNGLDGVIKDLRGETRASKLDPEPEPLRHLRDYSNFITPRVGLLSADTWTFVVIYVRNLLLNWIVLIPLLASLLMLPRVVNAIVLAEPRWRVLAWVALAAGVGVLLLKPGWKTLRGVAMFCAPAALLLFGVYYFGGRLTDSTDAEHKSHLLGAMLAAGTLVGGYVLAYMRLNRPSNTGAVRPGSFWDRHRDQSSFLWLGLLPLTVAAMLLTTFWVWFRHTAGVSTDWTVVAVKVAYWPGHYLIMGQFSAFLLYGVALGITSWLCYLALAGLSWVGATGEVVRMYQHEQGQKAAKARALLRRALKRKIIQGVFYNAWRELVVTLAASLVGAVLLYVVAVKLPIFYDPVVSPFYDQTFKDVAVRALLPYDKWYYAELYTWLAYPAYLFVFFLSIALFTGFTSRRWEGPPGRQETGWWQRLRSRVRLSDRLRIEDEDREWLARASAWVFIAAAGWIFVAGLVMFGPLLFFELGPWVSGSLGGAAGLGALLGGGSARTPGNRKEEGQAGWLKMLGVNLLVAAAFVFFCCIVIAVSLLAGTLIVWLASTFFPDGAGSWLGLSRDQFVLFREKYPFQNRESLFLGLHFPSWLYLLVVAFGLHAFGRFFAATVNLNKFSLHAGYRDRIIRAFLGASQRKAERQENPFTGFDPRDNLHMQELRPQLLRESDFRRPKALEDFVAALNKPVDELRAPDDTLDEAARWQRRIALCLRDRISGDRISGQGGRPEGASNHYFKEPPTVIEYNPSFRAALFADLNRILQDEPIPGPSTALPAPEPDVRGAALIGLNRERLSAAFPYIERPMPPYPLMHVVNMALNLVGGDRLAWQQRRAESFTATPLHSGSLFVGYRRTRDYGGRNGISLGTAVAISGAAASSNMGYFSPSVFVTFVLTFFNARLGWWLGNPGASGADTFFRSHPQNALSPIIDEAFGLTDDDNPYVLLSDGGHFENLGLYEMVLRRCRNIVVVDGSADPEGAYDDLGGAVRKIRIDFGIPIDFTDKRFPILSRPDSEKESGGYYAVGRIRYRAVDGNGAVDGKLVYIKPAVYHTEPRDIFNYAKGDPSFPHESTADQFFDEPQFESHRMLGFYILERLLDTGELKSPPVPTPDTVSAFVSLLERKSQEAEEKVRREREKKKEEKSE